MVSILKRTGYHTCKKTSNITLNKLPFLSVYAPKKNKYNFLGTGYYVWEGNIELARWWGKKHYKENYVIVKMTLQIPDNELLDLVGNVEQIREFLEIYDLYKEQIQKKYEEHIKSKSGQYVYLDILCETNKLKNTELRLVEFIQWLKKNDMFPFNIVKIKQNSRGDEKIKLFGKGITFLNVKQYYCFYSKKSPEHGIEYFINKEIIES